MRLDFESKTLFLKYYVVFEDNNTIWWLRILRRNFKHCYVLIKYFGENKYLEINPCSNRIFIREHEFEQNFDYIEHLKVQLKVITKVEIVKTPLRVAPMGLFSCVECVKRIIGLHSFATITPYQLYNKINDCGKKVLTK